MSGFDRSPRPTHSRRALLAAGGVLATSPVINSQGLAAQTAIEPLHIRRDIATLDPAGPEIASLRRGVAAMQQLSQDTPSDPRGWRFQANIHGAPEDEGTNPYWRQCQHGSFFFLPWHRMYLYWFERILRWASGDPSLALPYWNYARPNRRALPEPFRLPADPSNPLYLAERDPAVNAGARPGPALNGIFDQRKAFATTQFFHTDALDISFGGARADRPVHSGADTQNFGQLELAPHSNIHVLIGGRFVDTAGQNHPAPMGDLRLAARDPIFWLHHANIDRLWRRWLQQGDGRENPYADDIWMNTAFTFFDEHGDAVQMTASDVLNPYQLRYTWDDEPPASGGGPGFPPQRGGAPADEDTAGAPAAGGPPRATRRSLLGSSREGAPIELGAATTVVTILRDATGSGFTDNAASRIVLTIEGLRGLGVPGVTWLVYLHRDLPPGGDPPAANQVGQLSLFGLQPDDAVSHHGEPTANQGFDVTRLAQTAMVNPAERGRFAVSFVPQLLSSAPAPAGPWAMVERVRLSAG